MATPTFHEQSYTFVRGGTNVTVYLKYIKCNQRDIRFRKISGSVKDSGYYGVNGTFLSGSTIWGIAIDQGEVIGNYGALQRNNENIRCGTFAVFENLVQLPNGARMAGFSDRIGRYEGHVYNGVTMTVSNARLAVGGTSLFTSNTSMTKSEFDNYMFEEDAPQYDASTHTNNDTPRARTALVYIGGESNGLNTVLLTVYGANVEYSSNETNYEISSYGGVTLWELRSLINEVFSPMTPTNVGYINHAINLDGGNSTQIAFKRNNVRHTIQAKTSSESNRSVYTMLCVDM